LKEWFDKEAIPKNEYPKVRATSLDDAPIPCFAQIKYDGELTYLVNLGDLCYTVNKWGRVRTEYKITNIASKLIPEKVIFVGELYLQGGNLYDFLRSRSQEEKLRLAVFDVVYATKPYEERLAIVQKTFPRMGSLHVAEGKFIKDRASLREFYHSVIQRGFEGIVVREPFALYNQPAYKIKKLQTADVVVMGLSKDSKVFKLENGKIGSLLIGAYKDGKLIPIGRVGSGFSEQQRRALYEALMEFKIGEDDRYIYVKPSLVIEVSFQELVKSDEYPLGFTLRHPVFLRIRFDKTASPKECNIKEQFHRLLPK